MPEPHPSFPQPENIDTKVWRYMSFSKFVSLLASRTLWFARPDTFQDKLEGSYSSVPVPITSEVLNQHGTSDPQEVLAKLVPSWTAARQIFVEHSYISCWNINEDENDGLWRIYGDISQMVCIQSTYRKLWNQLPNDSFMGVVQYIDYREADINPSNFFRLLMHKRKCFEHEREARSIIWRPNQESVPGLAIPIDPIEIIESVILPPFCGSWYKAAVQATAEAFSLKVPIKDSSLELECRTTPNYVISPELVVRGNE